MTLLAGVFLTLFLLTYFCGFILMFVFLEKELEGPFGLLEPTGRNHFFVIFKSLFWIFLLLYLIFEEILFFIAEIKYEKKSSNRLEDCDCNFKPMNDSTGIVCNSCGYFISDALIDNNVSIEELKAKHPHQIETKEWQEFRKTFWYKFYFSH